MHDKFDQDIWKIFRLSRQQGKIEDVKYEKSQ